MEAKRQWNKCWNKITAIKNSISNENILYEWKLNKVIFHSAKNRKFTSSRSTLREMLKHVFQKEEKRIPDSLLEVQEEVKRTKMSKYVGKLTEMFIVKIIIIVSLEFKICGVKTYDNSVM